LELESVIKRYGNTLGAGPISFVVKEGEFLSLLGPSGCGKTTILRCIAGFEDLTEGTIKIDGVPINDQSPNNRDIGMVFQQHALFPHLTVFNNIAFGLKLSKISKSEIQHRVKSVLRLGQLEGLEDRNPSQLSGGQQQRVALARTLVMEPSILLFDEPLSSLDLKLRIQMRNEIKMLHRKLKKTSIYVTHDQGEALALSDRIAVIFQGKIQQIGTPTEIYESPNSSFVADFIGESNILKGRLESVSHDGQIYVTAENGMKLLSNSKPCLKDCSVKSNVYVAIRQERILLTNKDCENSNVFNGRVDEIMYLGEGMQLTISLNDGHRVMLLNKTSDDLTKLRIGGEVRFMIDPKDVIILSIPGDV